MNRLVRFKLTALLLAAMSASAQTPSFSASSRPVHHCSVEQESAPLQYPEELKGSGIQGTVLIQAAIGEDGCTKSVTVVKKVHPKLDRLATQAVNSWKFSPARKDGKPVMVLVQIPVEFKDPGR